MMQENIFIEIPANRIPQHIGFIMDGNRRWCKENNKIFSQGYHIAVNNLENITKACLNFGVKHVSFFAFSVENWKRDGEEIATLMKIFQHYIDSNTSIIHDDTYKVQFIGNLEMLDNNLQSKINQINQRAQQIVNPKIHVNICISYSGKDEITRAAQKGDIQTNLDTGNQPDLDLLIRTSGEQRISNFMLWQAAYAELYFTNKKWPDFDYSCLSEAILNFVNRKRNYGK